MSNTTNEPATLTRLNELPKFNKILSGLGSQFLIQVPRNLISNICIVEVGQKKVLILYASQEQPNLPIFMAQVRGRLLAERLLIDGPEVPCSSSLIEQLNDFSSSSRDGAVEYADSDDLKSQSQSKLLFEHWVQCAVEENATDIHIQVVDNKAEVRVRIDGSLEMLRDESGGLYTPARAERAIAWAYNNASFRGSNSNSQFSVSENLYCMISAREIMGRSYTLRFQSIRGSAGVKVVCRLLNISQDQPTLSYAQLGYAGSHIDLLENASKTSSGFVFFAGVTGSGKTTSLKTFIETHPDNGSDAFYSIEDPVEYPLKGVHQIPVQRDLIDQKGSALKYGEVIAALMRADPGCVLMGEIRDVATASAGQQVVETGHMACATVHAHLLSGIVPRLTDSEIGMSRYVLSNPNVLSVLVYQALVPLLCPHCKVPALRYDTGLPDHPWVMQCTAEMRRIFKLDPDCLYVKNPSGCERCRLRGTRGLTVVAEVYSPDRRWLQLIREHKDQEAIDYFRSLSDGDFLSEDLTGKTVFEHTLLKASKGIVDPRQCLRFESLKNYAIVR